MMWPISWLTWAWKPSIQKASKPLEINDINLRIKNTFEPEHPGTLITREYICETKRVEVITGTEKVVIIDIYDPSMVGTPGSDFTNYAVVL